MLRLKNATIEERSDSLNCLEVCKNYIEDFEFVSDELKNSKPFINKLFIESKINNVRKEVFSYLGADIKSDKSIMKDLLSAYGCFIYEHLSSDLKIDKDFILQLCSVDAEVIQLAKQYTKNDPAFMETDFVKSCLKVNGLALKYFSNPCDDMELVRIAVNNNGLALEYASKRLRDDDNIVNLSLRNNKHSIRFASERFSQNTDFLFALLDYKTDVVTKLVNTIKLHIDRSYANIYINRDYNFWSYNINNQLTYKGISLIDINDIILLKCIFEELDNKYLKEYNHNNDLLFKLTNRGIISIENFSKLNKHRDVSWEIRQEYHLIGHQLKYFISKDTLLAMFFNYSDIVYEVIPESYYNDYEFVEKLSRIDYNILFVKKIGDLAYNEEIIANALENWQLKNSYRFGTLISDTSDVFLRNLTILIDFFKDTYFKNNSSKNSFHQNSKVNDLQKRLKSNRILITKSMLTISSCKYKRNLPIIFANKDLFITLVKISENYVRYMDKSICNCSEIFKIAVINKLAPLYYASKELLRNTEFCRDILKIDFFAFRFFDCSIKQNKEMFLFLLNQILSRKSEFSYTSGRYFEVENERNEIFVNYLKEFFWEQFNTLPKELKEDNDIQLLASQIDGLVIQYANPSLFKNERFVQDSIKSNPLSIIFLEDGLKSNSKVLNTLLYSFINLLVAHNQDYEPEQSDWDLENYQVIERKKYDYLKCSNSEINQIAIEMFLYLIVSNMPIGSIIHHKSLLLFLKFCPLILKLLPENARDRLYYNLLPLFPMKSFYSDRSGKMENLLRYFDDYYQARPEPKNRNELAIKTISKLKELLQVYRNGNLYKQGKIREKNIVYYEVLNFEEYFMFSIINCLDREIVESMLSEFESNLLDYGIVKYSSNRLRNNFLYCYNVIKTYPLSLQFFSDGMKDNEYLVLEAVSIDGMALQFASARLKDDSLVVETAAKNNGLAIQFASERLRGDSLIVETAVENNGLALQFASNNSLQNWDIISNALSKDIKAFKLIYPVIRNNLSIMVQILNYFPETRNSDETNVFFLNEELFVENKKIVIKTLAGEIRDEEVVMWRLESILKRSNLPKNIKNDLKLVSQLFEIGIIKYQQGTLIITISTDDIIELFGKLFDIQKQDLSRFLPFGFYVPKRELSDEDKNEVYVNIYFEIKSDTLKGDLFEQNALLIKDKFDCKTYNFHIKDNEIYNAYKEIYDVLLSIKPVYYKLFPLDFRNDLDLIIESINKYDIDEHQIDKRILDNPLVIQALITKKKNEYLNTLQYAPSYLKRDFQSVLQVISIDGMQLEYAAEVLKHNKEIVLRAVQQNPQSLMFASNWYNAERKDYYEDNPNNDIHIVQSAVSIDAAVIKYASEKLKNNYDLALFTTSKDGLTLCEFSDEIKNNKTIVLNAIEQNPMALSYIKSIRLIKEEILEICNDYDIVLKAVSRNGLVLQFVSDRLKDNPNVVSEACKQNPLAIQFASNRFTSSLELAKHLAHIEISTFKFFNESVRSNKKLVLNLVKHNGLILEYCSGDLKNDKEVVLSAVKQNGLALEFASKELSNDEEVISSAIMNNSLAEQFIRRTNRTDRRLIVSSVPEVFDLLENPDIKEFEITESSRVRLLLEILSMKNKIVLLENSFYIVLNANHYIAVRKQDLGSSLCISFLFSKYDIKGNAECYNRNVQYSRNSTYRYTIIDDIEYTAQRDKSNGFTFYLDKEDLLKPNILSSLVKENFEFIKLFDNAKDFADKAIMDAIPNKTILDSISNKLPDYYKNLFIERSNSLIDKEQNRANVIDKIINGGLTDEEIMLELKKDGFLIQYIDFKKSNAQEFVLYSITQNPDSIFFIPLDSKYFEYALKLAIEKDWKILIRLSIVVESMVGKIHFEKYYSQITECIGYESEAFKIAMYSICRYFDNLYEKELNKELFLMKDYSFEAILNSTFYNIIAFLRKNNLNDTVFGINAVFHNKPMVYFFLSDKAVCNDIILSCIISNYQLAVTVIPYDILKNSDYLDFILFSNIENHKLIGQNLNYDSKYREVIDSLINLKSKYEVNDFNEDSYKDVIDSQLSELYSFFHPEELFEWDEEKQKYVPYVHNFNFFSTSKQLFSISDWGDMTIYDPIYKSKHCNDLGTLRRYFRLKMNSTLAKTLLNFSWYHIDFIDDWSIFERNEYFDFCAKAFRDYWIPEDDFFKIPTYIRENDEILTNIITTEGSLLNDYIINHIPKKKFEDKAFLKKIIKNPHMTLSRLKEVVPERLLLDHDIIQEVNAMNHNIEKHLNILFNQTKNENKIEANEINVQEYNSEDFIKIFQERPISIERLNKEELDNESLFLTILMIYKENDYFKVDGYGLKSIKLNLIFDKFNNVFITMLKAVSIDGRYYKYCSYELQRNEDFTLKAINGDISKLEVFDSYTSNCFGEKLITNKIIIDLILTKIDMAITLEQKEVKLLIEKYINKKPMRELLYKSKKVNDFLLKNLNFNDITYLWVLEFQKKLEEIVSKDAEENADFNDYKDYYILDDDGHVIGEAGYYFF